MVGINNRESLEVQLQRRNIQEPVYWFKKLIGYLVLQELPNCRICDTRLPESALEIIADSTAGETRFTVACPKMHEGGELSGTCGYVFDNRVNYEPIYQAVKTGKNKLDVTMTINR